MADYLKIPELARRLDVSEKTARRYVRDGTLPSVFVGGAYRVSEGDLEKYLEGAKVQPGKAPGPAQLEPGGMSAPKVEAPPSPDLPKEGGAGAAALSAWSEYLDASLKRVEELREMFLALRDLDALDPEGAEHRIDMTFAVASEFALNVDRVTNAHERGLLTRVEGERLTLEEREQLVAIYRRTNELLRRRNGIVAFVGAVHNLAEDMAIKKAVKDLLEDAGIPDWDAAPKDV